MKQILLFIAVVIFSLKMTAQRQNPWQKIAATTVENQSKVKRTSIVSEFEVFSLDVTTFKNQLLNAPKRVASVGISTQYVYFPDVDGNTTLYRIYEASVMHPELQAQFPEIKSYIGVGVDDKSAVIRFSMTLFGLHAMILSPKGTVIIDPYTSDLTTYMVYKKKNAISSSSFECLTTDVEAAEKSSTHFSPRNAYDIESNTGIFRTYRLGLACTEEYAQFHINSAGVASGTVAERDNAVLSAMNVTMTRVNGIFERDMSLTMVIVPNNANVIFFLPEKPDALTNSNGSSLINEIQPIINTGIGSANYDIGHVFSTGGGGIAQLNSPCGSGKARGVTGQGSPVGDTFDVDYVAHEMGHQFGANHTQNNSCQRNLSTAVEPGSASTIMGYAGICLPSVQNNSDDYFHIVSLTEMDAFVAAAGNCSVNIANNNNAPVVEPIPNYIIPISTAFVLPGNATDADGDTLTYCWEQTNNQISTTQPPVPGNTGGPSFRSLSPSLNPDRYMPRMTTILTGNLSNTPANLWEVVPSVARTMNFALTVRDNELINGGQTTRANMTVTTTESAGPFVVSSPNTNVSWLAGSNQNVTWNVAGTTANGVDSEFVDIYLSTNGGTTFPILLASKVPNDGLETVSMPASTSNQNRIMVRGNNHIFLDVSNTNFTISASSSTFLLSYDGTIDGQNKTVCQGQEATYDLIYSTLGGFSAATTFSVSGNPVGSTATLSPTSLNANGTVQLLLSATDLVTPGIYQMVVTGTSGATTKTVNIYVEIKSGSFQSIIPVSPVDMASGVTTTVNVSWNTDSNATAYDYEFSSDSTFSTLITSGTVNTNQFFVSGLQNQTNYFWRVLPKNASCAGELSPTFRFTTVNTVVCSPIVNAANVPITISAAGTPTVNSTLTIPTGQNQSIVKITVSLNITHTWMADLTVILISPLGTQIQLFSGQCGSRNNAVATFDDDGNALICLNAIPTISGTFIPSQPLSAFIGEETQGTWTLRISDSASGDGGTINSWGITICTLDETPLACGILTSTWNGSSWSNGVPVNNVAAVINGNYTSVGDIECCSLTLNNTAQVTIQSGHNLIVSGAVSVANTASFILENNANLIQLENVQNTGEITVNRATFPLMRLDYVMWSSPVTGSITLKQFSPSTLDNRFYTYNTVNNVYNSVSSPTTVPFEEGKGYLIRMPDTHPTTPTSWNGQFSGVPKNGAINIPLTYSSGTQKHNAIGNPYPSTLSAEAFLTSNQADLEGVLYFWRKTNNAAGTAYATYTLGGATTTSPTSPIPNGTIQVGQGFIVAATDVASPTARFTNDLRVDNTSNQFFRSNFGLPYYTQNQTEMNRIWLNLTNQAGLFSQMMIGYLGNATNEIDELIDGKYIGDSQIALSSLLATEEYVIQGKALPFETTDVVPLVFRTNVSGNFTVSLSAVDGLFEGDQTIFLRDNLTGNVSDLKLGEYSYFTETGIFSNRFEIIYQNSTLSLTENSAENALLVATGKQEIVLKSTIDLIESVLVFDVVGRTLLEIKNIKDQNFTISELTSKQQTLLLKITLNNGKVVTKKIVY
jgi:subtilisin-like proprotein convertase family protein